MNRKLQSGMAGALCLCMCAAVVFADDAKRLGERRHPNKNYDPDIYGLQILSSPSGDDGAPRGPAIFNIDFENAEGFTVLGNLNGQGTNVWTVPATMNAVVSDLNPSQLVQHIRVSEGTGANGTLVTATNTTAGAQPVAASSMSVDIFISASGGADYYILGIEATGNTINVDFSYDGEIYAVDLAPGATFVDTGVAWAVGQYKTFRADVIPSANQIDYYYDGALIYRGVIWNGTRDTIDRVGIRSDNYFNVGEYGDFDNIQVSALNATGACCDFVNGQCDEDVDANDCVEPNVIWSKGQTCEDAGCTEAHGACCQGEVDGELVCTNEDISDCQTLGGTFLGDATVCGVNGCPPVCSPGSEGQVIDFLGHGASGTTLIQSEETGAVGADNFTPAADGTLTKVRWWGGYIEFTAPGARTCDDLGGDSPDDFTIAIYNDALSLPFQLVAGPFTVSPLKENINIDLPVSIGPVPMFQYTVTGLNVPVLQDRCYWIEIYNNTTADCAWYWKTGPEGDLKGAQGAAGSYVAPADQLLYDLTYCIDVDIYNAPDHGGCNDAIELTGRCCLENGTDCQILGPTACLGGGGVFVGFNGECDENTCKGACCDPDDHTCDDTGVEAGCINSGGVWQGVGTVCTPNPCLGACCLYDGSCVEVTQSECEAFLPGGWSGSFLGGSTCATAVCATNLICNDTGGLVEGLPILTCGETYTVDNHAQARDEQDGVAPNPDTPDMSCYGGGASDGIGAFWVTFLGTGQDVEINTCGSVVSDTVLAVYTNPGKSCDQIDATDEVACSEDDAQNPVTACPDELQSRTCVPATVLGQLYYVQVTSFGDTNDLSSVGVISVNMICPCSVFEVTCSCFGDVGGGVGTGDGILDGKDVQAATDCILGGGSNCICADGVDVDTTADMDDIPELVSAWLNNTGPCAP